MTFTCRNNLKMMGIFALTTAAVVGLSLPAFSQIKIEGDLGGEQRDVAAVKSIIAVLDNIDPAESDRCLAGQPHVFKSDYGSLPTDIKAVWAYDLDQFIRGSGEDFLLPLRTDGRIPGFVPYSKRDAFANSYWLTHSQKYGSKSQSDRDTWRHEALLDGTEAAWRAYRPGGAAEQGLHTTEMGELMDRSER